MQFIDTKLADLPVITIPSIDMAPFVVDYMPETSRFQTLPQEAARGGNAIVFPEIHGCLPAVLVPASDANLLSMHAAVGLTINCTEPQQLRQAIIDHVQTQGPNTNWQLQVAERTPLTPWVEMVLDHPIRDQLLDTFAAVAGEMPQIHDLVVTKIASENLGDHLGFTLDQGFVRVLVGL